MLKPIVLTFFIGFLSLGLFAQDEAAITERRIEIEDGQSPKVTITTTENGKTTIEELYGKDNARTVIQNVGTKLYFPHQDLTASQELSNMLGRYTYHDDEGRQHSRNLLNPDEVSFLEHKNGALLFSGRERGILLKSIRPYYKNRKLLKRSKMDLPERKTINPSLPQLIPINDIIEQLA